MMPTIHDQLMAKCEEARDTYSENHPERVKAGTGCNPRGFNPGG